MKRKWENLKAKKKKERAEKFKEKRAKKKKRKEIFQFFYFYYLFFFFYLRNDATGHRDHRRSDGQVKREAELHLSVSSLPSYQEEGKRRFFHGHPHVAVIEEVFERERDKQSEGEYL